VVKDERQAAGKTHEVAAAAMPVWEAVRGGAVAGTISAPKVTPMMKMDSVAVRASRGIL
jgi:hypothetical protein